MASLQSWPKQFAAAMAFSAVATAALAENCREDSVYLRGDWGQARFHVEIADDPTERSKGLMFRENLPRSSGMLFVYDTPQPVAFWMKNTLIPLDMVFLDAQGVVTLVHHRAIPGDLTPIQGGRDIKAVLELNGGLARAMGLTEGSEMRHPAFDRELALWPCDEEKSD